MSHFTPVASLAGGVLIGAAALLLWLGAGRVAGISGIVGGLPNAPASDRGWRLAFLVGLVVAPLGYAALVAPPAVTVSAQPALLVVAGLLVGFGTRLGNGCTSGHGVCGIARLSWPSIAATCTYMLTAGLAVFLLRHGIGG